MKAVIVIRDGMVSAVLTEENEAIEYRVLDADGIPYAGNDTVTVDDQDYYLSYTEESYADPEKVAAVFAIE